MILYLANWSDVVTTGPEELELRVELVAGDASLHRLLATLHRKRASIEMINCSANTGIASIVLVAPAKNAHHIISTLVRETTIGPVDVVPSDTLRSFPEDVGARVAGSDEGDVAR